MSIDLRDIHVQTDSHGHEVRINAQLSHLLEDPDPRPDEAAMLREESGLDLDGDDCLASLRSADPTAQAAIAGFLRWCFPPAGNPTARVRSACNRFIVSVLVLQPDLAGGADLSEVAAVLGITRAATSLAQVRVSGDLGGARCPTSRCADARVVYGDRQNAVWTKRKAAGAVQEGPPQPPPRPRYSPTEYRAFLATLDPGAREEGAEDALKAIKVAWRSYERQMLDYQGQLTEWTSKQATKKL